jgi:hypothetical protein
MAGFADQMVQSGLQSSQQFPDLAKNVESGVGIAQTIENVQRNRELLEQQKQQLQTQKVGKLIDAMEAGAKMPSTGARNAYMKYYIPKVQDALGLQDFIPPETLEMIKADPEQVKKFGLLKSWIMNGHDSEGNPFDYITAVAKMDPEEWANLSDKDVNQLEASEKFRVQQQGLGQRAAMFAGAPGSPKEQTLANTDLAKFSEAVSNPSNRKAIGMHKAIIDSADRVGAFENAIGMPTGKNPPPNETEPQYIARLNKADRRQVEEVVKNLDAILSMRGQQTVSGAEHLRPATIEGFFQKYGESISNMPTGLNQGKFLERALDSIHRERALAAQKYTDIANSLKSAYPRAEKYFGKRMDAMISGGSKKVQANVPQKAAGFAPTAQQKQQFKTLPADQQQSAINSLSQQFGTSPQDIQKALGE